MMSSGFVDGEEFANRKPEMPYSGMELSELSCLRICGF